MKRSEIDINKLSPMMRQYLDIKDKYDDTIIFFRLGDFYEMFGDDAIKAHTVLEVILTKRQSLPMCGVPYHSVCFFESDIKKTKSECVGQLCS